MLNSFPCLQIISKPLQLNRAKKREKDNHDGARIYAQNAIRAKTTCNSYLRLSSRVESVASRLEQSSTVADHIEVTFGCGKEERLPCAFLELIQRHDGFRGFLGQNAKGIFASTHAGRS